MNIFKTIEIWLEKRRMQYNYDRASAWGWIENGLSAAQKRIDAGDYATAHKIVNRALLDLAHSNQPLVKQARDEAQRIFQITSAHVRQLDPDKSSSDYYNAANALRNTLQEWFLTSVNFAGDSDSIIAEIIKLCQLAIRKDNRNGDAHIMLAHAYFVLALTGRNNDLRTLCSNSAGAVIYRWKTAKMHTANSAIGKRVSKNITSYFEKPPHIPAESRVPTELVWLAFGGAYASAVNPDEFSKLEALVNK